MQEPKVFVRKAVLKNLTNFIGKYLCSNFIKKRPNRGVFLSNWRHFKSTYFEQDLQTTASIHFFFFFY